MPEAARHHADEPCTTQAKRPSPRRPRRHPADQDVDSRLHLRRCLQPQVQRRSTDDARRFLVELRERFATFGRELHPDKTRLIEFGRYAAQNRRARGLGKPETFDFLGFTHIARGRRVGGSGSNASPSRSGCGRNCGRSTTSSRYVDINPSPSKAAGWPPWCEGTRPTTPCTGTAMRSPRSAPRWRDTGTRRYRRRSQRDRMTWARMNRILTRWLPRPRVMHPFPEVRFAAIHPR